MNRIAFAISLLAFTGCGAPGPENQAEGRTQPNVEVASVEKQEVFAHWVSFQASVEARKNIVLNAEMGGVIRSINAEEGQFVKRGKVLVVLDSDVISQNISELESSIELAEYMRDKQQKLFDQNIGTEYDLKQAESQLEQLNRKLATLRTQAGKSVIAAPFDGYVEDIGSYVGELAAPQIPLVRFINLDMVTIVAEVSEAYINKITEGTRARVRFPALDTTLNDLLVTRTGKIINPSNRTFRVEIDIQNKDNLIVPNLLAEVDFQDHAQKNALTVPSKSILEDKDGNSFLYLVNNDSTVVRRTVSSVFSYQGTSVIESGLKEGDIIVVNGAEGLVDSMKVDILKY